MPEHSTKTVKFYSNMAMIYGKKQQVIGKVLNTNSRRQFPDPNRRSGGCSLVA
jgi:hypothetical protein